MKILHVVPYMHSHAGGPSIYVDRLARQQVAAGHAVQVLTTDAFFVGEEAQDRALFADAPYETTVLAARAANRPPIARGARRAIEAALGECDVLHVHTLWSWLVRSACRLAQGAKRPWVLMPHGMLDPYAMASNPVRKRLYLRWIERPNLEGAGCLCFTSNRERQLAIDTWPTLRRMPHVITVPGARVPEPERHPGLARAFRERHGLGEAERVLLFLSRVHPKKGLEDLLAAFERLGCGSDWRLVVAGQGEAAYVRRIRARAEALPCADQVVFIDHVAGDDKWGAFAAADLFVLPSRQENFGLVVAEALHMGTPVLVSSRVNSGEHVMRARAGRIYDFDRGADGLARALESMMRMPADQLAGKGGRGPAYARQHLTWAQCGRETEAAYAVALGGGDDAAP